MFEAHFGLSGPPFQLNADPAFFFGSRGHSHALAYMRFGVHQAEGFIVVTGEVGAGKTTLVRTLMASLDQDQVVAAQVVSTQLEAGDLLRAILAAFGVTAAPTASKAQLISSLEAYLTALAAQGRRALLVIDEAQNLDRAAVEELRMLSNFQLGTHGLLQSFLVGQPELRRLLQSRSMEQLRQRVIASCHLGPLDEAESRGYVEHRLRHVGWTDRPRISDEAFAEIHRNTGGIPRRINRLCGRLMLGAFLDGRENIGAEDVIRTSQELNAEIGEAEVLTAEQGVSGAAPALEANAVSTQNRVFDTVARTAAKPQGALLCWVDSVSDYLRAGALARSFASNRSMPLVVAVVAGRLSVLEAQLTDTEGFARPDIDIGLDSDDGLEMHRASILARAVARFAGLLEEMRPVAVAMLGASDEALLCGMLAQRAAVPLLRIDAGRLSSVAFDPFRTNATLLDRLADVVYTENLVSYHALHKSGVASERLQCVGDLMGDVIHTVESSLPAVEDVLKTIGPTAQRLRQGMPFGIATCAFEVAPLGAVRAEKLVASLVQCTEQLPLLWLLDEPAIEMLRSMGVLRRLGSTGLVVVPAPSYRQTLGLLAKSSALIAGADVRFLGEAMALGVPCLLADDTGDAVLRVGDAQDGGRASPTLRGCVREICEERIPGGDSDQRRTAWDGGAVPRITAHLESWLRGRTAASVPRADRSGGSAGAGI